MVCALCSAVPASQSLLRGYGRIIASTAVCLLIVCVLQKTIAAALTAMQQSGKLPELLLLIAVYFHTAQHTAIADLVRATLGAKILLRNNFVFGFVDRHLIFLFRN